MEDVASDLGFLEMVNAVDQRIGPVIPIYFVLPCLRYMTHLPGSSIWKLSKGLHNGIKGHTNKKKCPVLHASKTLKGQDTKGVRPEDFATALELSIPPGELHRLLRNDEIVEALRQVVLVSGSLNGICIDSLLCAMLKSDRSTQDLPNVRRLELASQNLALRKEQKFKERFEKVRRLEIEQFGGGRRLQWFRSFRVIDRELPLTRAIFRVHLELEISNGSMCGQAQRVLDNWTDSPPARLKQLATDSMHSARNCIHAQKIVNKENRENMENMMTKDTKDTKDTKETKGQGKHLKETNCCLCNPCGPNEERIQWVEDLGLKLCDVPLRKAIFRALLETEIIGCSFRAQTTKTLTYWSEAPPLCFSSLVFEAIRSSSLALIQRKKGSLQTVVYTSDQLARSSILDDSPSNSNARFPESSIPTTPTTTSASKVRLEGCSTGCSTGSSQVTNVHYKRSKSEEPPRPVGSRRGGRRRRGLYMCSGILRLGTTANSVGTAKTRSRSL
jgi:hypothetical protein